MVRLGFIGAGGYACNHIEGFSQWRRAGRVEITGLADPNLRALDAAQARWGELHCYTDYLQLLDSGRLDAVVISAPIGWHEIMTADALKRGLYVMLEKPPVPLLPQLEHLVAADRQQRVMVGFQQVYSQAMAEVKRHILQGELGTITQISSWGLWKRDASYYRRSSWAGCLRHQGQVIVDGPCTNACAHFLNNLAFLAGTSEVGYAVPTAVRGELYRLRPIKSYDAGCVAGSLNSGPRFFAGFSHASKRNIPATTIICGNHATLRLERDSMVIRWPDGRMTANDDGRTRMREAFLDFCLGQTERNLTPLASMRSYLLMTNLMMQSSGGIVDISDEPLADDLDAVPRAAAVLPEALEAAATKTCLLGEVGVPWAVAGEELTPTQFSLARLEQVLQEVNPSTPSLAQT